MNWTIQFADRTKELKRTAIRELLKLTRQPGMISFAGGLPAPELFAIDQVKAAVDEVLRTRGRQALQYGETEGLIELREWIAHKFSRPHCELQASNVIVTSGGQQAIDLLGRILLNENDQVVVENPTYLALLSAWRWLGVQFLPVPSDADGLCVDGLESLLERKPKLVYSVPTFQNPQGTTLILERRHRLVELLRKYGVGLIEDNPYGELRFCGDVLPDLFELSAKAQAGAALESNVVYIGTFSKVLMPALRVGWVIAPEELIEKLVRAKQATDLQTGTLSQFIAWELVRRGFLETHIPQLRSAYRERWAVMLEALEKYFPSETTWTRPEGGMFLMATLPLNCNAQDVFDRALRRQVAFVPGQEFHVNGIGNNTLRLNFSNSPPDLIEEGIKRLGEVLKEMIRK